MKKLGVVKLNYMNYQDTIECTESFLKQEYPELEIVIVDNHSDNNSWLVLKETFSNNSKVRLLKAKSNLGFARGNNLGIRYARRKLGCDAVFVINSDTRLLSKDVCMQMMEQCEENVGVINPVCIGLDGEWQRPYGRFTENLIIETLRVLFNIFSGTFQNIFKIRYGVTDSMGTYDINALVDNGYVIQGSAYILTPEFFKHYNQLYPKTFLYGEELNLAWYLKKAGLRTAVVDSARILHKEAGSTEFTGIERSMRKFKFQMSSFLKSLPVFVLNYNEIVRKYNKLRK